MSEADERTPEERRLNRKAIDFIQATEQMVNNDNFDGQDMCKLALIDAAEYTAMGGAGIEGLALGVAFIARQLITFQLDLAEHFGGKKAPREGVYDLLRDLFGAIEE